VGGRRALAVAVKRDLISGRFSRLICTMASETTNYKEAKPLTCAAGDWASAWGGTHSVVPLPICAGEPHRVSVSECQKRPNT
jgi:hypothetical protein